MGDCQSKDKAADVSEPTIESTEKPSNDSTKETITVTDPTITEIQKSPDQEDQNDQVVAPVEETPVKNKPENATSFGQNKQFYKSFLISSLCLGDKREIISIHIGQAGVQIGNSCWELFCLGWSFSIGIFDC